MHPLIRLMFFLTPHCRNLLNVHSWKTASKSSSTQARKNRVADGLRLLLLLLASSSVWAEETKTETTVTFNIPQQRADLALIEFAEQADLTLVFPSDLVAEKAASQLIGEYTLAEGAQILLAGTGLSPTFSNRVVLSIAITEKATLEGEEMNIKKKAGLGTFLAAMFSVGAGAQEPTAADGRGAILAIDEIIVTARKRQELIQDIPWSIRALSERELEQLGADGFLDYARTVAGLSFVSHGPGFSKIVIRGITEGPSTRNQATTGIYIDETPVTRNGFNPDLRLFDVQRVEVLRGPQGTLYGSASMGGTIKVITNKPDVGAYASKMEASYSGTQEGDNNTKLNAMINVPLVDGKVAVRAVGYYRDIGGFINNPALGRDNVNTEKTQGGRLAARFEASEALTVTASFIYQNSDIGPPPEDDLNLDPISGEFVDVADLTQSRLVLNVQEDEQKVFNLTIDYDLGWAELLSSTSYFERSFYKVLDISDSFGVPLSVDSNDPNKDFVQEIRLASTGEGSFAWLGGVFYSDRNRNGSTAFVASDTVAGILPPFLLGNSLLDASINGGDTQLALFGEVAYDLTDRIQATVGLRWFDVETDFNVFATGLFAGAPPGAPPLTEDLQSSESSVNPKFLLSYRATDDTLIYAQAAQGYRIGGTNQVSTLSGACGPELATLGLDGPPSTFDSDSLWNYEVGAKTTWFDDRLVLNGAAYFIDWSDVQVSRVLQCGFAFTDNAGEATSKGFELEMRALPLPGLELTGSLSFNDVEIGGDPGILASLGAVNGEAMPGVPKWSFSFSAHYSFPVTDRLSGFVRGDYQYVDGSASDFSANMPTEVGGYDLGNFRLGISGDSWETSIFINNVSDERATLAALTRVSRPFVVRIRPRTIGLNVKKRF